MLFLKRCIGIILFAVILTGCAKSLQLGQPFATAKPAPRASFARLYVYRLHVSAAETSLPVIRINGVRAFILPDGGYTSVLVAPGTYTITAKSSPTAGAAFNQRITVRLKAHRNYYLALFVKARTFAHAHDGYLERETAISSRELRLMPYREAKKQITFTRYFKPRFTTIIKKKS